jgi:hypothetical protein
MLALPFIITYRPDFVYLYIWFLPSLWINSLNAWFGGDGFTLLFLEVLGLISVTVIRQLVLIFKSVNEDKPFTKENAGRLRRIAICCFALFGVFLLKTFYFFTPMSFVATAALLIASFAALVFSSLFNLAVEFKSENDLTI